MAIEDLTDVKPGDLYTWGSDKYIVESICKFPIVTLRKIESNGAYGRQIHGAVGSRLLNVLQKVEKETPK